MLSPVNVLQGTKLQRLLIALNQGKPLHTVVINHSSFVKASQELYDAFVGKTSSDLVYLQLRIGHDHNIYKNIVIIDEMGFIAERIAQLLDDSPLSEMSKGEAINNLFRIFYQEEVFLNNFIFLMDIDEVHTERALEIQLLSIGRDSYHVELQGKKLFVGVMRKLGEYLQQYYYGWELSTIPLEEVVESFLEILAGSRRLDYSDCYVSTYIAKSQ